MAILNFPAAEGINQSEAVTIVKSIDKILLDSQVKTEESEQELEEIPFLLAAHFTYRNILRQIKRTRNINESISRYMGDSCPPHMHKDLDIDYCKNSNCNSCWKEYILKAVSEIK